jgi:hypothetical protein
MQTNVTRRAERATSETTERRGSRTFAAMLGKPGGNVGATRKLRVG